MLGRNSSTVRRLRALRKDRALRAEEGVYVAEGLKLAEEALTSNAPIELAVVSPRLATTGAGRALRNRLDRGGFDVAEVQDAVLDRVQDARSPQPVLLVVRRGETDLETVVRGRLFPTLLVVAHGIQDPGNLGSLIRTADAAGASGFLVTGTGADLHHPRTVRATMGSIFRLPAIHTDVVDLPSALSVHGVRLVGTEPGGGRAYDEIDWTGPVAIVLGREGSGLPTELLSQTDVVVSIPLADGVESLSVSAAGAVLLFEAARQRR